MRVNEYGVETKETTICVRNTEGKKKEYKVLDRNWLLQGVHKSGVTRTLSMFATTLNLMYESGARMYLCSPEGDMREIAATGMFISYTDAVNCLRAVKKEIQERRATHNSTPVFVLLDDLEVLLQHPTAADLLSELLYDKRSEHVQFIVGSHELHIGTALYRKIMRAFGYVVDVMCSDVHKAVIRDISSADAFTYTLPTLSMAELVNFINKHKEEIDE